MAAPLILTAALGGCVTPKAPLVARAPLPVGGSYTYADGAAARREAEGICAARGQRLVTSIRDRFVAGSWEFREGCA